MQLSLHKFAWTSDLLPVRSAEGFGPLIGSTRCLKGGLESIMPYRSEVEVLNGFVLVALSCQRCLSICSSKLSA